MKIITTLAFGAAALFTTGATAAPLNNGLIVMPDRGIENVRVVCNEYGRCWERGGRRVVIQENYGPRYYQRPGYYDRGYYNSGPSVGIGVGPVGVGIGVGPRW
jgi:hypothetical protein